MVTLVALLKFGTSEHLAEMRRGHLFMNTLSLFRALESDQARGDGDEGLSAIYQPGDVELRVNGEVVDGITSSITMRDEPGHELNLFCMYGLRTGVELRDVDPRNVQFGDSAVIVTDVASLNSRIRVAVASLDRIFDCGAVKYFSRSQYSGELNYFRKFDDYEYQREIRYLVSPGDGQPLVLDVGDLSDITMQRDFQDLSGTKLEPRDRDAEPATQRAHEADVE